MKENNKLTLILSDTYSVEVQKKPQLYGGTYIIDESIQMFEKEVKELKLKCDYAYQALIGYKAQYLFVENSDLEVLKIIETPKKKD